MKIPKTFWALALAASLAIPAILSMPSTEAAGPATLGRTNWQVFQTPSYVSGIGFSTATHGDERYYAYAPAIPGGSASGWQNCGPGVVPGDLCYDANTINMQRSSRLPGCWSWADFTFFQSFVSIPANATVTDFRVVMGGADDGARVSIINSAYPGGFVFPGSYIFLGGAQSTTDLAPYVVKGEMNRVVITQVDDCAVGNNLGYAAIELNGTVVPVQPSADLSIVKSGPSSATVGGVIGYSLTVTNPSANAANGVVVADVLPSSVKYVSSSGPCTHDGASSGGVLTCSGINVPAKGFAAFGGVTVQALQAGTVVNTASITGTGTLLDPNPANNQASATTNVVEPPAPPAPPFTIPGTLPVSTANICLPPYMDQNLQTQYWWARAAGGGPLNVTLFGVSVNSAESGVVSMKVVDPGNVTVGTASVPQPSTGEIAAPPVVVASPVAGTLYRIEVKVASPSSGPTARHYRLMLNGATLVGTDSTLQAQAEHEDVRWRVNVGASELLDIAVLPAAEASLTTGTVSLIPPGGGAPAVVVPLTAAGGVASVASPAAGQWTVAIAGLDGHYLLRKTGGADTGIYAGWNASGSGSLSITVTHNGGTYTAPVLVQVGDAVPFEATGTATVPKLRVGRYPVTIVGTSVTATATVTCDGVAGVTLDIPNNPPAAVDDPATTPEDTAVTVPVPANDSDVDGDTLSVASVTQGAYGTVAINSDGTVTYTPAANFNGTDTFTYTVSDGHGGTATAIVTATVTPVNDPPVAGDDSATTPEDTAVMVSVLGNDSDVDGDTLSVASVTQGAHGTVAINGDGTVTYTPAPNFNGTDTFTYTVSDGFTADEAEVTVTVAPVNDAPVALDDTATTDAGTPVTVPVLTNDTDIDGDMLTVTAVGSAGNGSAVLSADGTVTYTPAPGFSGTDTFSYTVVDGNGGEASAVVTVHVSQFAGLGRMTGGGTYATGSGKTATKQTWGFTLHCDGTKANLEFNDHTTGGRFHLEEVLTTVCSDDPSIEQLPPSAPLDTLYMVGRGRWNNIQGATIEVTLVDGGEPGTADSVRLTVWASDGSIVSSVAGRLTGGNHQAHE
ncbi:MAG: tandem-95 repeat protein [Dehalococcoidia bacterium]|nr:MAG: tandem-95 repeat protein [Dehalococcoidia bacterium]